MATKTKQAKKASGKKRAAKKTSAKGSKAKDSVAGGVTKGAASLDAGAHVALAGKEALAGTRAAGKAISATTSTARLPLIAGGSLLAGLSGGMAVIKRRRNGHRRKGAD